MFLLFVEMVRLPPPSLKELWLAKDGNHFDPGLLFVVVYLHICTVFDPKAANVYQETELVHIVEDGSFSRVSLGNLTSSFINWHFWWFMMMCFYQQAVFSPIHFFKILLTKTLNNAFNFLFNSVYVLVLQLECNSKLLLSFWMIE